MVSIFLCSDRMLITLVVGVCFSLYIFDLGPIAVVPIVSFALGFKLNFTFSHIFDGPFNLRRWIHRPRSKADQNLLLFPEKIHTPTLWAHSLIYERQIVRGMPSFELSVDIWQSQLASRNTRTSSLLIAHRFRINAWLISLKVRPTGDA